ncbi:MAG: TRAP transporter fused permease subunit, partial [Candidatus Rokubacteria bacterium]|nr:TRAP transporter fused permease subunit [Candidatus Rokubacteria bacterium]
LEKSGAGQFFFDLAKSVAGRFTGGPAKMSCISSALFGTVSGSAVANVIVDGWLTIPLMKRLGFQAPMAAAIEAVASTGGMLMPPVMGAAAFILADIVGLPYFTVALAAAIPAILYYVALFMAVHAHADQRGFRGLPPEQIPRLRTVMLERGYLVLPLVVIIQQVVTGYSAVRAVLLGMACVVVLSFLRRETALTPRRLWEALDQAARATAGLSMACACAGVIIAMVMYTALGLKAGTAFIGLSGGYLFVALVLVMVLCLILGMGLPATAAYITTAVLAIPALTKLGVNPLAAHLFVFYFANISAITPPVMLASYAAAGIGGANPMRTGYAGMRIGAAGYLIPFLFVYKPALLILGVGVADIALAILLGVLQVAALVLGLQGWTPLGRPGWVERGLLVASAVAMLHPGLVVNLVAVGAIAGAVALTARAGIPRSTLERAS